MKCWKVVRISGGHRFSALIRDEFLMEYPRGAIVGAHPGTLGIFCFDDLKVAHRFALANLPVLYSQILQVRGIGWPSTPLRISSGRVGPVLRTFYGRTKLASYYPRGPAKTIPPASTICFQAVEVLT